MGLLGRRKKRSEDEDLDDEDDSKPKRKRRARKPPAKPWGRKERFWVLAILLLTVGLSAGLALSARSWKLPGLPRIKVPNLPKISFISNETVVIEGNKKNLEKSEKIIQEFNNLTRDLSGVYGLYVVHLNDGYSFGVNDSESFEPASLNKLPVILTAYRLEEKGEVDLDEEYVLKDSDKIRGSGSLSGKSEGTIMSYRELLNLMGKQSDNTAFGIIRELIGEDNINRVTTEIGMSDTSLTDNETIAKDIGVYFERLHRGGLVAKDSQQAIFASLTETVYEDHIPAGVPEVRVVHKYGRETNVVNDAGIVYADKNPFVLVILSKGVVGKEADDIIPQIAEMVYRIETE